MIMENNCEPMETYNENIPSIQDDSEISFQAQKQFSNDDMENLYASLGITADNSNQIRYEAIYLRTSNELIVKDVIDYFSEFNPHYVEMVDDESFNVVWLDRYTAAKALFFVSQKSAGIPIRAEKRIMIDNMRIPPGRWLLGEGHINLSSVLVRFSMRGDRNPRTKELCSHYSRSNSTTISSGPVNKKNPWGNLSQCWDESYELSGRNRGNRSDFRDRVQLKARRRTQK